MSLFNKKYRQSISPFYSDPIRSYSYLIRKLHMMHGVFLDFWVFFLDNSILSKLVIFLLIGDLGRMDEDGYFWIFGRTDDVLIIDG